MSKPVSHPAPRSLWKIIGAASAGPLIEWYDFYLFGSLAAILSTQFFPPGHPTAAVVTLGVGLPLLPERRGICLDAD